MTTSLHTKTMMWLLSMVTMSTPALVESRIDLAELGKMMPPNAVVCTTADECRQKFQSINTSGGFFYVNDFPTKGCFIKNNNGYFGTGGTEEEISMTDLPPAQERLWCDIPTDTPTYAPSKQPTSSPTQMPTTSKPSTSPSTSPSNAPSNSVRVSLFAVWLSSLLLCC